MPPRAPQRVPGMPWTRAIQDTMDLIIAPHTKAFHQSWEDVKNGLESLRRPQLSDIADALQMGANRGMTNQDRVAKVIEHLQHLA